MMTGSIDTELIYEWYKMSLCMFFFCYSDEYFVVL